MQKWQHKIVNIDIHMSPVLTMARWGVTVPGEPKARETKDAVEQYLNELGAEGWELVSAVTGSNRDGIMTKAVLFFKRPLVE